MRLALGLLALAGCEKASERSSPDLHIPDPSTRAMVALLAQRAAQVDPSVLPYAVNDRRAAYLAGELKKPRPSDQRLGLRSQHAVELLNSGKVAESIEEVDTFRRELEAVDPAAWPRYAPEALLLKAMAYLRMAELENCCDRNSPDSCLLPIQGLGIHQKREGSTRAIGVLREVLNLSPDSLRARWLLNIACMTLGTYPQGVPEHYLIPPSAFASEHPLARFENVAQAAGLDVFGLAGGAILDDFDNDGRLDLLISGMGLSEQTRFFHNNGDGSFEERTKGAGLTGEVGGLNMVHADYNNDGFVDALVLRGGWMGVQGRFPISLLRNNAGKTFTDVTQEAGLMRFAPTQTAVWLDYDGDGWLDLYVGNESTGGNSYPCHLFHNNGNGTFMDLARELGVDFVGFVKGVASADYNNDGRPDLYVSVMTGNNLLFRNDGPQPTKGGGSIWRFSNVAAEAGVTAPHGSFGTFFFDYDNDGWEDLFVAGYLGTMAEEIAADYLGLSTKAERGRLYHNEGNGTFKDVTQVARLYRVLNAMGLNFGDLDNDGFLDFYLGTGNPDLSTLVPNRMFRNAEGRFFQDVTSAGNFGHLQKGHAICFGDIDNDGDQDIFEKMGGAFTADLAYSTLYENPGNDNGWLGLELQGVRSNRCAIGARIKVVVETKSGPRQVCRTVSSGGSFGDSPLRQEIGLGAALKIAAVEILWPATGQAQKLDGLELRRRYRIVEGKSEVTPLSRISFPLSPGAKR